MTALDYQPVQSRNPYPWAFACWSPLIAALLLLFASKTSLGLHVGLWLRAEFFHNNLRMLFVYFLIITMLLAIGIFLALVAIIKTRTVRTTVRFKISLYLATALYVFLIIEPLHATLSLATEFF